MSKTITVEICRRADNGRICTRKYADSHPKTTTVEHRQRKVK